MQRVIHLPVPVLAQVQGLPLRLSHVIQQTVWNQFPQTRQVITERVS